MISFSREEMEDIGYAVYRALLIAFREPEQSEPQLVANFVYALSRKINGISLSGTKTVSAGGVFVHSRPLVACSSFPKTFPRSVEIGDLLLTRTLVVGGKVKERRALLLQAKKVSNIPAKPDNENQWHLYEQWPRFTYAARSGGLTGKTRRIKEPDMYDAAKYLLIGQGSAVYRRYPCCIWPFHWHCCRPETCRYHTAQPTAPELGRYRCFANELVEFIAGNAGKAFVKPRRRTLGWDRVIQDLIAETAKAKTIYTGRAMGNAAPAPRGNGVLFFSLATPTSFSLFGDDFSGGTTNSDGPPKVPSEWGDGNDGRGISIIEIVVERGEG